MDSLIKWHVWIHFIDEFNNKVNLLNRKQKKIIEEDHVNIFYHLKFIRHILSLKIYWQNKTTQIMTNIKNLRNINRFHQTITCQHINSFYPTTTTHTLENCGIDSYILESHWKWIDQETIHCFHAQSEYLFPYKTWGETVVGSQSGESTSTPCASLLCRLLDNPCKRKKHQLWTDKNIVH